MKIKGKKVLALISSLALCMSVLTGCSSEKEETAVKSEANEKLVVGVSTEYFPWCFKENDENKGFEVDVWNEIGKRAGFDIEYQTAKFSGLVGMLDAGKIDTVAHQMSTTEERRAKYDFTDTYTKVYKDTVSIED